MALFDKIKTKASELGNAAAGKGADLTEWMKSLPETLRGYADRFNPEEMWDKLKAQASKAGQELVVMVLTIFYSIRDRLNGTNPMSDVPMNDVLMLAGAIAYFVCPADLIPDFMPGIGYSDDLAALTFVYKKAYSIFTSAAKGSALAKTAELLGDKFDPEKAAKITQNVMSQHDRKTK